MDSLKCSDGHFGVRKIGNGYVGMNEDTYKVVFNSQGNDSNERMTGFCESSENLSFGNSFVTMSFEPSRRLNGVALKNGDLNLPTSKCNGNTKTEILLENIEPPPDRKSPDFESVIDRNCERAPTLLGCSLAGESGMKRDFVGANLTPYEREIRQCRMNKLDLDLQYFEKQCKKDRRLKEIKERQVPLPSPTSDATRLAVERLFESRKPTELAELLERAARDCQHVNSNFTGNATTGGSGNEKSKITFSDNEISVKIRTLDFCYYLKTGINDDLKTEDVYNSCCIKDNEEDEDLAYCIVARLINKSSEKPACATPWYAATTARQTADYKYKRNVDVMAWDGTLDEGDDELNAMIALDLKNNSSSVIEESCSFYTTVSVPRQPQTDDAAYVMRLEIWRKGKWLRYMDLNKTTDKDSDGDIPVLKVGYVDIALDTPKKEGVKDCAFEVIPVGIFSGLICGTLNANLQKSGVNADHDSSKNSELRKTGDVPNSHEAKYFKPEKQWFYRDDHNEVRGPFSSTQMLKWIRDGFFEETTVVYDADMRNMDYELKEVVQLIASEAKRIIGCTQKESFGFRTATHEESSDIESTKYGSRQYDGTEASRPKSSLSKKNGADANIRKSIQPNNSSIPSKDDLKRIECVMSSLEQANRCLKNICKHRMSNYLKCSIAPTSMYAFDSYKIETLKASNVEGRNNSREVQVPRRGSLRAKLDLLKETFGTDIVREACAVYIQAAFRGWMVRKKFANRSKYLGNAQKEMHSSDCFNERIINFLPRSMALNSWQTPFTGFQMYRNLD